MADDKNLSDEIAQGVTKALDEQKKKQGQQILIGCGIFVVAAILIITVITIFDEPAGVKITREEYGEEWPFTVEEGRLDCEGSGAVVFRAGSTTYGVNGLARQTYEPIGPIWRDHPSVEEDPQLKGRKMIIGPIIDRGLLLCE